MYIGLVRGILCFYFSNICSGVCISVFYSRAIKQCAVVKLLAALNLLSSYFLRNMELRKQDLFSVK